MFKHILLWLLANAILPALLPVITLAGVEWFINGSFPFIENLAMLFKNGFYIFSALALILSLLEDYDVFKVCAGPFTGALLMLIVVFTLIMFYLMQTQDPHYVAGHQIQFLTVWGLSVVAALCIKFQLLTYKKTRGIK